MRELIKKDVDGKLYEFQQMNTTQALRILAKIAKLLGEPMMIALGGVFVKDEAPAVLIDGVPAPVDKGISSSIKEVDSGVLAKAVKALMDRMDETEVISMIEKLTSEDVLCNHQRIVFNDHFQGDIPHLMKVIAAALSAQYGNFFDALQSYLPAMPRRGA